MYQRVYALERYILILNNLHKNLGLICSKRTCQKMRQNIRFKEKKKAFCQKNQTFPQKRGGVPCDFAVILSVFPKNAQTPLD